MVRKSNDHKNKLLYDPDQRINRRLGAFSMPEDKDLDDDEEENVTSEEELDNTEDVNNEEVNETDEETNTSSKGIKDALTGGLDTTPQIGAKDALAKPDLASQAAGKAAGASAGAGAAASAGAGVASGTGAFGAFIAAHWPIILGIVGIVLIVLLILIIAINARPENEGGYYDNECDFNSTKITLTCTDPAEIVSLEEYVYRATYYLLKGEEEYSDAVLQAVMVAVKTHILASGNYDSSTKAIGTSSCAYNTGYANDEDLKERYEDNYNAIYEYLFLPGGYEGTIESLGKSDTLTINKKYVKAMIETNASDFEGVLNQVYNVSKSGLLLADGTIYIGDDRVGDLVSNGFVSSNSAIYSTNAGLNWLQNEGVNSILNKTGGNKYNLVVWLGLNDYLTNDAEDYFEFYKKVAKGSLSNQYIFVIGVGPVNEDLTSSVTNKGIKKFNKELKKLIDKSGINNLYYINPGFSVSRDNYDSTGLRYNAEEYKEIYDSINDKLGVYTGVKKELYDLAYNCEYHEYEDLGCSSAYWWPIGYGNETSPGIYGEMPLYYGASMIVSDYGYRIHPRTGVYKLHAGIDINAGTGEIVIASRPGTVQSIGTGCTVGDYYCNGGRGNYVTIDHGDGITTTYMHLSRVLISSGETAKQGQILGLVGNTGNSTGPHLHFEMRADGEAVDPKNYLVLDDPRPVCAWAYDNEGSQETVCQALKAKTGYSDYAIAAIMANLAHEGAFMTNNVEDCYEYQVYCIVNGRTYGYYVHYAQLGEWTRATTINGQEMTANEHYTYGVNMELSTGNGYKNFTSDAAGYGLVQWTTDTRKQGLFNLAKSTGRGISSLDLQIDYLMQELSYSSYSKTTNALKNCNSSSCTYDTAVTYCKNYEGPAGSCSPRGSSAVNTYLPYVLNGCN